MKTNKKTDSQKKSLRTYNAKSLKIHFLTMEDKNKFRDKARLIGDKPTDMLKKLAYGWLNNKK